MCLSYNFHGKKVSYIAYLFVLSILKKNLCWYLNFHSRNDLFSFIMARLLSISLWFIEVSGGGRGGNSKLFLEDMRRAVERSALGSVGVHFWGFFW